MSRNLARVDCAQCPAEAEDIILDESPRPLTKEDTVGYYREYAGMLVAHAHCKWCGALYLAWIDERTRSKYFQYARFDEGRPVDLSYRSSFNDEPWILDLPVFHVARFEDAVASPDVELVAAARPVLQRVGVIEYSDDDVYFRARPGDDPHDVRARARQDEWRARRDHLVKENDPPVDDSRLLPLAIFVDELNPPRDAVTMWPGRGAPEVFESIMPKSKKCDVLIYARLAEGSGWPMVLSVHLERTSSYVLPNGWVAVVARWSSA